MVARVRGVPEGRLSREAAVTERLCEHDLVLLNGVFVAREHRQLRPVVPPLRRLVHAAAHGDPERLQMLGQHPRSGERVGLEARVVGHPPEVELPGIHPLEHRRERAHRAEPRVVAQHDLVVLIELVAEVCKHRLVPTDVEAGVLAHDDLVAHTRKRGPAPLGELAVDDHDDADRVCPQPRERVRGEILHLAAAVPDGVADDASARCRERNGRCLRAHRRPRSRERTDFAHSTDPRAVR